MEAADDYCWLIYCPRTNNVLGEATTLSEARAERDSWCDDGLELLYMKPVSLIADLPLEAQDLTP